MRVTSVRGGELIEMCMCVCVIDEWLAAIREEMGRAGFVGLLKRVFESHMESAAVMQQACGATWNLAANDGERECVG